jgi:Ser/Thr protein kinase RdoA (MazF antagonist)
VSEADEPAALVHGLAGDRVEPDWPPLTGEEARWVAGRWGLIGRGHPRGDARVLWRSPRPLSAAGLVSAGGAGLVSAGGAGAPAAARTVFVKRHDPRVRDPGSLAAEHRFARHLRGAGIEAPEVLITPDGLSAVARAAARGAPAAVYEVHALASGSDLYRDAESWTGFRSLDHARSAGALLARLHLAAGSLDAGARPFRPLVDSDEIVGARDPLAALAALIEERPGLRAGLAARPWRREIGAVLGAWLAETARRIPGLPRAWTHGDWHPSNLTWSRAGKPVAVLDLGLANRTTPARDVAIAIERSCVSWLAAAPRADLDAVGALLEGYTRVRALVPAERAALPALTATAHVEFALSEVEYYAGVLGSPERAQIAYRDYLIGHGEWFASAPGEALLDRLAAPRGG